jgi:hypothetical protein
MPDRPSKIGECKVRPLLSHIFRYDLRFLPQSGSSPLPRRSETKATMSRKLVWIDQQHFLGFGCSDCGWRFNPSGAPTGTSFDEMMRNFVLQRDHAFTLHACTDHPRAKSTCSG